MLLSNVFYTAITRAKIKPPIYRSPETGKCLGKSIVEGFKARFSFIGATLFVVAIAVMLHYLRRKEQNRKPPLRSILRDGFLGSQLYSYGETAAEEIGVHPMLGWYGVFADRRTA